MRAPRKVYVKHPPEVWGRARALYLEGRTAGQVAALLGCSISAVRLQASRGGWTRRGAAAGEADGAGAAGAAGPAPLGEGRFDPPLSPCARADGRPSHLRLTPQAWEVIRGERLAGASIAELAERHGVSEGTIRRHARDEGWTNTDRGEAVSRAMVEDKIAADAFAEGRASAEREAAAAAESQAALLDAEGAAAEADPLEAARTLLRRAAAAAVAGRVAQAGAGVKLAGGLARAAAALGLGDDGEGGWDDEDDEPRLSPEALEALREDVRRRYAKFDRPEACGAAGAPAAATVPPEASAAGEPDEAVEERAAETPAPGRGPAAALPHHAPVLNEPPPQGLSGSAWPRPLSAPYWPRPQDGEAPGAPSARWL